jgi:hypothetical protein
MKEKLVGIFVLTLLIFSALPAMGIIIDQSDSPNCSLLEGGWYEEIEGVKILHVSGSYYEMGYQHGYLISDMVNQNVRAALDTYTQAVSYEDLLDLYDGLESYIPQEIKDEMQGLADGSGLNFDDFAVIVVLDLVAHDLTACVTGSAWDTATVDGKLYHFRSHDFSMQIKDPETGIYLHDNIILQVRTPDTGYATIYPNYAGSLANYGGFNEEGITIGQTTSWCMNDISNEGIPMGIRIKLAIEKSSNINEAIDIINSNKTRGYNFIISDSEEKTAKIIESSATNSYIGSWDDPEESNSPYYSIENIVRRSNLYISEPMANLQREKYNPNNFLKWLLTPITKLLGNYDDYKYEYFIQSRHYQLLSKELNNNWGNHDLNSIMNLLRSVYRGDQDFFMKLLKKVMPNRSYTADLYQWVVCPETNEFVISFADGTTSAHENNVHNFNMVDLWNASPP